MTIVREHISEKFREDSDPIHDLGIGIEHDINKWYQSLSELDKATDFYEEKYRIFLTCIQNRKYKYVKYFLEKYPAIDMYYSDSLARGLRYAVWARSKELIKMLIDSGSDVNHAFKGSIHNEPAELVEYIIFAKTYQAQKNKKINEKFTSDSDPIRDLGIGVISINIKMKVMKCNNNKKIAYLTPFNMKLSEISKFMESRGIKAIFHKRKKDSEYCLWEFRGKVKDLQELMDSYTNWNVFKPSREVKDGDIYG